MIIYHMYMYLSLCVTKHVCICLFCKMYSIKHQIQYHQSYLDPMWYLGFIAVAVVPWWIMSHACANIST